MFHFAAINIFIISGGAILVILARALPRIDRKPAVVSTAIERWLASHLPARIDAFLKMFRLRLLRRLKVVLLRVENRVAIELESLKFEEKLDKRSEETKKDFQSILSSEKE